jgi:Flp pilus assembly protein TadG
MKSGHKERGMAVVEMALVLPLLLMLILAIIEWGAWFYDKAAITNASREAARIVAVSNNPKLTAIPSALIGRMQLTLVLGSGSPSFSNPVSVANVNCRMGTASSVTVQYSYTGLLLGPLLKSTGAFPPLSATTVMCDE